MCRMAAASLCWRSAARRCAASGSRARHCPDFPEHPFVRQHDGAGKRHGRPSRANPAGVLGAILQNAATRTEEAAIRQRAIDLLHYVRIEDRADDLAKNLSYGDQRRLEIARALATEPKLLCLDEPAAGMNGTETAELRELIDGIRRDGTTILLIEHDVKLVMGLCDRVAVLDYGALVIEDVPAVVQKDQRVIEAYLGA
jgi:branched-chain amino acid transport system ATP-binding protein